MYDNNSKGISYAAGFFMLIAFAVIGILIASFISIPVWTNMTGKSFKDMEQGMSDPANSDAVKVLQCIQAIFGFLIPAIFTAFLLNKKPMKLIGFSGKINWGQVGLVFAILLTALFVSGFFSYVNQHLPITEYWKLKFDKMEGDYQKQVEAIVRLNNPGDYVIAFIIMGFVPALCEETFFRGGLQNFLTRSTKMPWLSIIIVSLLFSIAHISYYGFLPRFFLGLVLGLLYQYSGRIWLNILAHFLNNVLAIIFIYVYKIHDDSSWFGILALPILIALLYLFYKITATKKELPPFTFEEKQENPLHGI